MKQIAFLLKFITLSLVIIVIQLLLNIDILLTSCDSGNNQELNKKPIEKNPGKPTVYPKSA